MKKLIRKWLGIKDPEPHQKISKFDLRQMVGEAIRDTLKGKPDYEYIWSVPRPELKNLLTTIIQNSSRECVREQVVSEIEAYIRSERFIDTVVEKINRKQLKP